MIHTTQTAHRGGDRGPTSTATEDRAAEVPTEGRRRNRRELVWSLGFLVVLVLWILLIGVTDWRWTDEIGWS